jgi:hypothetical protein
VEVRLVDSKILQEEVVAPKADALESTESPQIMEEMPTEEEDKMEYPKEDKDMEGHPEEEEKDMEEHEDEEKDMEEHEDEEKDMEEHEDEKEMVEEEETEETEEMEKDKDYYEEGEVIEEEETMTEAAQIESQEESSSAPLDHSERAELEAFRRERKEGLIVSFEDDLSSEFLSNLSNNVDNYSYDELEVTLSKEFTRVNRENKKSKPNAFIYKPEVKSSAKSEVDIVKDLIQKYK